MNIIASLITLPIVALTVVHLAMRTSRAEPSPAPAKTSDEAALEAIEYKWCAAYVSGDADALASIMSDDYIQTNVRGEVSRKPEEVAEVRDGIIRYEKFDTSELKIQVYGDAAVVTGRTWIKGTVKKSGRAIDVQIRVTDTFVSQNGKWQVVASQSTPIPSATVSSTAAPAVSPGDTGKPEAQRVRATPEKAADRRLDFDFFMGHWRVHHRRLKERLADNHDWVEFEGTCAAQTILGGAGNIDDNIVGLPEGAYRAVTLRTYDSAKDLWSIWWCDGRNPAHLDPPVVGRFEDGVGTFYADDTFKGKPIRVRFLWTKPSGKPHWEQAFSQDGGKTWEINWTMDFTKTP